MLATRFYVARVTLIVIRASQEEISDERLTSQNHISQRRVSLGGRSSWILEMADSWTVQPAYKQAEGKARWFIGVCIGAAEDIFSMSMS